MKTIHGVINPLLSPDIDQDSLAILSALCISREKKCNYYVALWDKELVSLPGNALAESHLVVGNEVTGDKIYYAPSKIEEAYRMLKKKSDRCPELQVTLLQLPKKNRTWGEYVIEMSYK